jgi:deferrochelatase/peroxidase EfeB
VKLDRRRFLTRAGLGAVTAGAAGAGLLHGSEASAAAGPRAAGPQAAGRQAADRQAAGLTGALEADGPPALPVAPDPAATLPAIAFHGAHQAGILTPAPPSATFVSFDVVAERRRELTELLQTLTSIARFLTSGGIPPDLGTGAPPSDSGTLGPTVPADGLTVTVGVGSSLFDRDRYGLSARKPLRLTEMQPFPNDSLDPAQTGGDLLLQICSGSADTTIHALRQIAKQTRGGMQINWRLDGFRAPARPTGVPRNHFAFNDGIANPDMQNPDVADRLLWITEGIGEPAWATGGTYHVVRIIQQLIEFWDRVSLTEQQQMIGRFRDSGAPLDGAVASDIPDYQADPRGNVIPLTAHIRLANPRTTATEDTRIFRRGYNYDRGVDLSGNLDMGLVFNAFQQDLERQFQVTQTRLIGEPMVDYVSPVGGGYFFALPGVRDQDDWYASGLFA